MQKDQLRKSNGESKRVIKLYKNSNLLLSEMKFSELRSENYEARQPNSNQNGFEQLYLKLTSSASIHGTTKKL